MISEWSFFKWERFGDLLRRADGGFAKVRGNFSLEPELQFGITQVNMVTRTDSSQACLFLLLLKAKMEEEIG